MTKTRQPPSHGQITDPKAEAQLDHTSTLPPSNNALSSPGPIPKTTSPPSHGQVQQSTAGCPFSNRNTTTRLSSAKGEAQLDGDPYVPGAENAGGMSRANAGNTATSPGHGATNPGPSHRGSDPQRPFASSIPHLDLSITDPLARVTAFVGFARDRGYYGHDKALLTTHLQPVAASRGRVEFELTVAAGMTNRMRNLHGGAAALVFDCATTAALVTVAREGGWWRYAGVTRSLSVQYYRPVAEGERVRVVCEVVQVGKRLAQIRGRIVGLGEKGTVRCEAEHLKVNIDPEMNSKL